MFDAPAKRVGTGPRALSALWSSIGWRRKRWLRDLKTGAEVEVIDDDGAIYQTTVRGQRPVTFEGRRHPEPQLWLHGHLSSFAAARIYPLGKAPRIEES